MVLGKFGVYTAGPNTALIKSTGQIVIGGRLLAVPVLQRVDSLGLELRTITVRTAHGTTVNGVAVDVTGCCQVKIQGWTSKNGDGSGEMDIDYDAIRLAAQHFIGKRDSEIEDTIQKTVEGHQRAIVGTLTVEELYSDRAAFSKRIKDLCVEDMRNMGLSMVSYTVAEIVDELGYIEALGVRQTEKVKREATEGAAEHQNLARSKKGERDAAAHMNVNHEEQRMTESDKHLNMTKADAQNEVDRAVAIQKKAGQIEKAEQDAVLFVKRQEADAAETEAEREVIATRVERERFLKEINVNIPADAELYQKKNEADVVRATFAADTDRIRAIAAAESKAIRAKGKADIKILEERVRMWNECGNPGAILEKMIDILPEVAAQIAAPLEQTEKLVFIDSGDTLDSPQVSEPSDVASGQVAPSTLTLPDIDVDKIIGSLLGGSNSTPLKNGEAQQLAQAFAKSHSK